VSSPTRRGTVATFDEAAGLGTVAGDDGGSWTFHCTAVADGSRTIAAGTAVIFGEAPGHLGRWEATDLRPAGPGVAADGPPSGPSGG
jgi:cold shock CspA family protein